MLKGTGAVIYLLWISLDNIYFSFDENFAKMSLRLQSVILALKLLVLVSIVFKCYAEESCESVETGIHITKEEFDEMGSIVRSCSGEVSVNKCEGVCNSQVQPSVVTPTGFLKECFCCKEKYLRDRFATLTHCYDSDGVRLEDEERAVMEIHLKEPAECRCFKCGDFSR